MHLAEDYTARPQWLGGFEQNGRPVRTLETLRAMLDPHFTLVRTLDLPFLIREHARKFQWSVALARTSRQSRCRSATGWG